MTNKEYLTKLLSGLGVSDDDIDIILLKESINPADELDVTASDLAVYNRMSVVLKAATQNVTEGGYAVSWNMEAVKLFYSALCNELGQENVLTQGPKVRDRSNYW